MNSVVVKFNPILCQVERLKSNKMFEQVDLGVAGGMCERALKLLASLLSEVRQCTIQQGGEAGQLGDETMH